VNVHVPRPLTIRGRSFAWGTRTFLMGILNVTPDSFSGDGLQQPGTEPVGIAVDQARRMIEEGADLLDVGGESTRPGHQRVDVEEELRRVLPVVKAIRAALPNMPLSIDTTKPEVATAALDAGADLLNDVAATSPDEGMVQLAADRRVPLILMHSRTLDAPADVVAEVTRDLRAATERAVRLGCDRDALIVDPGIGFGKSAAQNVVLLRGLEALRDLGFPVLLGTSRKSTIGKVLGLPPDQRLEGTLATTALGIAAGADIVRVHDVLATARAARMADAIVRGWDDPEGGLIR
jgi:dihydropteroate synthase